MPRFHFVGWLIVLGLAACGQTKQNDSSTAFQPTQTQPIPAQPVPARPVPAGVNRATPIPTQPVQTQVNQTRVSKTQTIETQSVPFQPTQTQMIQARQQLNTQETGQEVRISLPADVLFDFDKANIRPDAADALRQTLTVIRYYKNVPIRIEGHTDSKGSDAYNQTLSQQRARSVQQWLISQGSVPASQLRAAGFGESRPSVPNAKPNGSDDPAGRQLNRRVEIIIQK